MLIKNRKKQDAVFFSPSILAKRAMFIFRSLRPIDRVKLNGHECLLLLPKATFQFAVNVKYFFTKMSERINAFLF